MAAQAAAISATEPDWSREAKAFWSWQPSRSLLSSIRDHQRYRASTNPFRAPWRVWAAMRHRFWSIVTGADIPLNCQIGGGLELPHPNGIVLHPMAHLGPNCMLMQQVTIGTRGVGGVPYLGGHVDVGPGAKILGPVRIGDHARIGANAVVLCDVPAGATAIGVPARVMPLEGHGRPCGSNIAVDAAGEMGVSREI
jgi:serine O-acetyltransferase